MTSREGEEDTLAGAIVTLRKRVGSQTKLAQKAGVTERTVKRWEHGAVPQDPARAKLIRLGVPAHLFERAEMREQVESRLRAVEGEVARIRKLLT